jgi:hypothetical protein
MIAKINIILDEYQEQNFILTVRQLYYQLVARGLIDNNIKVYKWLARLINDGRLAGLIDWEMIEDRTRAFKSRQRWRSGAHILGAAAQGYHMDMWEDQPTRLFVIIEKEALFGVFQRVCDQYDIPVLAARGYPSVSVLREFVVDDLAPFTEQEVRILHFGDHDPSGIDMTRDLEERINLFNSAHEGPSVELRRIALNMDQIIEKKPPSNPAKTTDSRSGEYIRKYGKVSWELDALEPAYLERLMVKEISKVRDKEVWEEREAYVKRIRERIRKAAKTFK